MGFDEKTDLFSIAQKEDRFDEAVYRIKKMVKNLKEYEGAISVVHKCLHRKNWFQSTEEIMAGIELIKNGVRVIHQQKIKRYKVDFVLPDHKVLLEIDGTIYHADKLMEGKRDGMILLTIGVDWHMVRINTDRINNNIRQLLPAIMAIVNEQDRLREKHVIKK